MPFMQCSYVPPFMSHVEARNLFWEFDKDKDGKIKCSELKAMLTNMGIELKDKDVSRLFAKADKDGE